MKDEDEGEGEGEGVLLEPKSTKRRIMVVKVMQGSALI